MPSIGRLGLAVILILALVVLGPKRLPELGKSMGRGIREFKGSLVLDDEDEIPARDGLPATAVGLTDESSDSERESGTSHPRPTTSSSAAGSIDRHPTEDESMTKDNQQNTARPRWRIRRGPGAAVVSLLVLAGVVDAGGLRRRA